MEIETTALEGCIIIKPKVFKDDRGYFFESFNQSTWKTITGLDTIFVQDNQAASTYGVTRGLHLQRPPHMQSKLVRAIQGRIMDVAVDVREGSPTYGQFVAVELSDENHYQLFVPKGFLHGYAVLSETALVAYKCDDFYNKSAEDSVHPFDATLSVNWGLSINDALLSKKDQESLDFKQFKPIS